MTTLERYLDAATRQNTQRSYQAAVRHFEVEWGGHLPATADSVARYLAHYASTLALNTLKQRLSGLANWHAEQGFPDPTRAPIVRKALRGIQALHPAVEKQAAPLQLSQLGQVADWLDEAVTEARREKDRSAELRHTRDRALVLLGFWRGFRGDELIRVRVEHLALVPGQGMTCFLGSTKGDRQNTGTRFKVPALSRLCPVIAVSAWIEAAGLSEGPLFRRVNRWGGVGAEGFHRNSIIRLLRSCFSEAGLASPSDYSGHSLRRGFAGWANANGWDVKTLMEYVGWRDVQSAMRYIDGADPFARRRIESGLSQQPEPVTPRLLLNEGVDAFYAC